VLISAAPLVALNATMGKKTPTSALTLAGAFPS